MRQGGSGIEHDLQMDNGLEFTVTFFVEDRFCGEGVWKARTTNENERQSIAWYCWRCGRVWARMVANPTAIWAYHRSLCEKCPYVAKEQAVNTMWFFPGSIWPGRCDPSGSELVAAMPYEVVKEQFNRHVEWLKQKGELI